jgi:hypothetical protein
MKKKRVIVVLFLLTLSGSTLIFSQQSSGQLNAIQTVVPFLTIAPDSRAGAMGDAGVATSPDVYSMHWNPAKFAFIDGNAGLGISYSPWLRNLVPDINIAYLAGYKRIDTKQVFAASLLYSSLGDVPFTDEFGNLQRTFNPNEFAFDAGYSRLVYRASFRRNRFQIHIFQLNRRNLLRRSCHKTGNFICSRYFRILPEKDKHSSIKTANLD